MEPDGFIGCYRITTLRREPSMRPSRVVLVSVIVVSSVMSSGADARPRIPGLLGAMIGGVGGLVGAHRHHAYARSHHHYVRRDYARREPARQVAPDEPRADGAQPVASTAPAETNTASGQINVAIPQVWPALADDIFNYLFWPTGNDDRFWTHGYGDVVEAAFRPPRYAERMAARRAAAQTTTAAASTDTPKPCATQQGSDPADGIITRIEQTIQPTDAQRAALDALRTAVQRALEYIANACAADRPQTPTARLDAMEDRLWAARQALLITRAPIAKLYDQLTDEQKARLSGPQGEQRSVACNQANVELPMAAFEQRGRPNPQQRAGLEALRTTSAGLAKLVAASCPTDLPATPVQRLDAADKRLNTLLYSVVTLRAPLDALSPHASNEPKTR
jgi:LTXXQ motif family protein